LNNLINLTLTKDKAKFTHHSKPIFETPMSLILPKKNPNSKRLLKLFNSGFKKLKKKWEI